MTRLTPEQQLAISRLHLNWAKRQKADDVGDAPLNPFGGFDWSTEWASLEADETAYFDQVARLLGKNDDDKERGGGGLAIDPNRPDPPDTPGVSVSKHLPGRHNQKDHGRWARNIPRKPSSPRYSGATPTADPYGRPELGEREYWILTNRLDDLKREVGRLGRRAVRYFGATDPIRVETLDRTWQWTDEDTGEMWRWQAVRIVGEPPVVPGFEFIGKIEHIRNSDGTYTNILKAVPGQDIPDRFRNAGPNCDLCRRDIYRRDTFLVRNQETGQVVQLGRDDLRAYTGADNAEDVAKYSEIWAQVESDLISMSEPGGDGAAAVGFDPLRVVEEAAAVTRVVGRYVRTDSIDDMPTRDAVAMRLLRTGRHGANLAQLGLDFPTTEADREKARAVIEWVRNMEWPDSDYLWNLTVALKNPVTERTLGIAASAVAAYDRAVARGLVDTESDLEDEDGTIESQWVGEKKQRFDFTDLTVTRRHSFEGTYGTTWVYNFRDPDGNALVWFASRPIEVNEERWADVGDVIDLKATVKDHKVDTYKGRNEKQTIITRGKLLAWKGTTEIDPNTGLPKSLGRIKRKKLNLPLAVSDYRGRLPSWLGISTPVDFEVVRQMPSGELLVKFPDGQGRFEDGKEWLIDPKDLDVSIIEGIVKRESLGLGGRLAVPVFKHLQGRHDEKLHGRWAQGRPKKQDPPSGLRPRKAIEAEFKPEDFEARRKAVRAEERKVAEALATGQITPQQAMELGWDQVFNSPVSDWQPLPSTLYHATGATAAIALEGFKTRREVGSSVLGGGTDQLVSFTGSLDVAKAIAESLREVHDIGTGKLTAADLVDQAREQGFLAGLVRYWDDDWEEGDPLPSGLQQIVDGVVESRVAMGPKVGSPRFQEIVDRTGRWYRDMGVSKVEPVVGKVGKTKALTAVRFTMSPEGRARLTMDLYKTFSAFREQATGRLDPLFWNTDPVEFSRQFKRDNIGVVEASTRPGAMGQKMLALDEWRTLPVAVESTALITKHLPGRHNQKDHGRWARGRAKPDPASPAVPNRAENRIRPSSVFLNPEASEQEQAIIRENWEAVKDIIARGSQVREMVKARVQKAMDDFEKSRKPKLDRLEEISERLFALNNEIRPLNSVRRGLLQMASLGERVRYRGVNLVGFDQVFQNWLLDPSKGDTILERYEAWDEAELSDLEIPLTKREAKVLDSLGESVSGRIFTRLSDGKKVIRLSTTDDYDQFIRALGSRLAPERQAWRTKADANALVAVYGKVGTAAWRPRDVGLPRDERRILLRVSDDKGWDYPPLISPQQEKLERDLQVRLETFPRVLRAEEAAEIEQGDGRFVVAPSLLARTMVEQASIVEEKLAPLRAERSRLSEEESRLKADIPSRPRAVREATKKALEDAGVVFSDGLPVKRKTKGSGDVVYRAGRFFPQRWVERAEELGFAPISVKTVKGRAYYSHRREIAIRRNDMSAAIHEVGHMMERIPEVADKVRAFYRYRTTGYPVESLGSSWRGQREFTIRDRFSDPYMGRVYDWGNAWEVLSTGLQKMFSAPPDSRTYPDDEHLDFLIGLMLEAST